MSQAPGLSGTPDSGQRSSALTSASCARSSARPTSPTMRATRAITLADSMRQMASMARCVAEALITPLRGGLLRRQLGQRRRGLDVLGVVGQLVDLPDLDLELVALDVGGPLRPLHGLVLVARLDDPVAADQLLGLGERAVGHGRLAAGERDARAGRARLQPVESEQHAGV